MHVIVSLVLEFVKVQHKYFSFLVLSGIWNLNKGGPSLVTKASLEPLCLFSGLPNQHILSKGGGASQRNFTHIVSRRSPKIYFLVSRIMG